MGGTGSRVASIQARGTTRPPHSSSNSDPSHLGRREEALTHAQEAVALYRKLAAERPDAFLPDLAMSLGALGSCYRGQGQTRKAKEAFEEALGKLSPLFLHLPEAFARLMAMLLRDYLTEAAALKQRPNTDLIAPLLAAFEKLQKAERVAPTP